MDSNSELPLSDLKVEDVFVSFMKRRPNLSIATIDEEYTENDRESDWIELSEELNAKFAEKSLEEWKKSFSDWNSKKIPKQEQIDLDDSGNDFLSLPMSDDDFPGPSMEDTRKRTRTPKSETDSDEEFKPTSRSVSGRKPGRPRKHKEESDDESTPKIKRPPGRPRKHKEESNDDLTPKIKRKPGRPRKHKEDSDDDSSPKIKRKPGRPPKPGSKPTLIRTSQKPVVPTKQRKSDGKMKPHPSDSRGSATSGNQNCFVCSNFMYADTKPLSYSFSSSTCLSQILESWTGTAIAENAKKNSAVCFDCFENMRRFEEAQDLCRVIQKVMTSLYNQTHAKRAVVKQEIKEEDFEHDQSETLQIEAVDYSDEDSNGEIIDDDDWDARSEELDGNDAEKEDDGDSETDEKKRQPTATKCHPCDVCNKYYTTKKQMQKHRRRMHIEVYEPSVTFLCEPCKKSFRTKPALDVHLSSDHGNSPGPYECTVCMKLLTGLETFRNHYYAHFKEHGTVICNVCGTEMNRKCLYTHMKKHSDHKPFVCEYVDCKKAFRSRTHLVKHHRVHTGEKIFSCPICIPEKRFTQHSGKSYHMKRFHGINPMAPVICQICGKDTITKSKLKRHQAKAHEVPNYEESSN